VVGYVAIGFPLGGVANLVLRSRALWSELELSPIPKLVLQGTRDSYSPLSTLRDLVLQYNEFEPKPGPLELQVGELRTGEDTQQLQWCWDVDSVLLCQGKREAHFRHSTVCICKQLCVVLRCAVQTVDGADHFFQGRWQVRGHDICAVLAAGGGRMLQQDAANSVSFTPRHTSPHAHCYLNSTPADSSSLCFLCLQEVADKVMAWIQLQVDTHSRTSATA
jgi:hypothetical protein